MCVFACNIWFINCYVMSFKVSVQIKNVNFNLLLNIPEDDITPPAWVMDLYGQFVDTFLKITKMESPIFKVYKMKDTDNEKVSLFFFFKYIYIYIYIYYWDYAAKNIGN